MLGKYGVGLRRQRGLQVIAAIAVGVVGLFIAVPTASASIFGGIWSFNQGWGHVVPDLSGNGLNATMGSTPGASDPTWIPGAFWGLPALHFNGNDYLTVADSPSLDSAQITVGAIVRAGSSPGTYRYIAAKGAFRCSVASYGLYTGASGGLEFYVSNGAYSLTVSPDATTGIWDGRWHRVVGTYDGSTVRLYVDGRQVGTGTPSTITIQYGLADSNQFAIGDYLGSCATSPGFVGDIAGVAVLHGVVPSPFG
jgi:hypothetical protein